MEITDINLTPTATLVDIGAIPGRTWGSPTESYAAVLLVHGLGGHSGWFEPLARRLKVRQIFALSYDQVGFGKRKEQVFSSSNQWLNDLVKVTIYLKALVGDKPVFIIGNSMGGLIALKAASLLQPTDAAGIALLAPAFEGHPKTFPWSYKLTMLIKSLLAPDQEFPLPYRCDLVSGQESVRLWLENDQERRFIIPGRMILSLLALTQGLRFSEISLSCPVLMLTAGQDYLVDNKVNQNIFKKLLCPEKQERSFGTSMHDLTLDSAINEVADEVVNWIHKVNENRTTIPVARVVETNDVSPLKVTSTP